MNLPDDDISNNFVSSMAQAVGYASECLHRWASRTDLVRAKREKVEVLKKHVEVLDQDLSRAEEQIKVLLESKETVGDVCQGLEKENALLTAEVARLSDALREATAHPVISSNETIIPTADLSALTARADAAEAQLLLKEDVLARERAESSRKLRLLSDEKEAVVAARDEIARDNNWLVREGIKEFVGKLLDSSEFATVRARWCDAAKEAGYAEGVRAGYRAGFSKTPMLLVPHYDPQAPDKYDQLIMEESLPSFPYLEDLSAQSGQTLEVIRGVNPKAPVL